MTLIQPKQVQAQISAFNMAALTTFSVTDRPDGVLAYVEATRSFWELQTQPIPLAPNKVIASSVPGRVWMRMPDMTSPSWAQQTLWQIDSSALGNDENTGLPGSPLKTCAELARRIGPTTRIDNLVDVEIISMLSIDSLSIASVFSRLGNFFFHGKPSLLLAGSVVGPVVTANPATNTAGSFVGSLGTGAQVGQRITLDPGSSQPGAYAWIVKQIAGDNVRVSQWLMPEPFPNSGFPTPAPAAPIVGDTYRIESLPVVPAIDVEFRADDFTLNPQQIFVTFKDLAITPPPIVSASVGASALGSMIFLGCAVNVDAIGGGCDYLLSGCRSQIPQVIQGRWFFNGGCAIGQDMHASNGGYMSFDFDFILQGGQMRARNTAFLRIAACAVFDSPSDGVLIEMSAARCKNGIFISGFNLLWGSGNAGVGVNCSNFLSYEAKPIITGTLGDARVGGTLRTWAGINPIPFVEPTNLSAIVLNV